MSTEIHALPTDPEITPAVIADHGISPDEYAHIEEILGRAPSYTELGIFSVMWSEHCSYKNSRRQLKKFPVDGPRVLVRAGEENAGVIDIGDGWAVSFKVESHNHPSAVEPFQGAATGVGGILRDIFTMGARPVIVMNSLRFGRPESPQTPRLLNGVVEGIAHYGNCMGIPTIGGDIYFDETYEKNCLVNAFSLGVMRHEQLQRGCARGEGNPVFYVGAATGRDGIHGATFASEELTEESEAKKSSVQVGDPFMEKLLLEACLELFATDYIVGIQDMGAAGLTCSTCETASRGGSGVEIELTHVPQREEGMLPYEILLSESQERMLVIVKKGCESAVEKLFDKWDLHAVRIGHVTDDGYMRVTWHDDVVAEIPAQKIADDAPLYAPKEERPAYLTTVQSLQIEDCPESHDYGDVLDRLLVEPSIARKQMVYQQYDHMVRTGTVVLPGSDAAVFHLNEADKYLALSADCNGRYCYLDPRTGGMQAVAESARNVVCAGGEPLALTDCLNFGNPEKPQIFWQFREIIEGLCDACKTFSTPVTGGNVSFYNENPRGAIYPTPLVVMVGLIAREEDVTTQWFPRSGLSIFLLDAMQEDALYGLGGSEYLCRIHGITAGRPPAMDLSKEKAVQDACLSAIREGIICSAHDCSEGGLGVALAEACMSSPHDTLASAPPPIGAEVNLERLAAVCPRYDALLFGEAQSRIVVSVAPSDEWKLQTIAQKNHVRCEKIGKTGGSTLDIMCGRTPLLSADVRTLHTRWSTALEKALTRTHK